jgi:hypothetical protein
MSIAAVQHLAQAFPLLAKIQGEYPGACGAVVVLPLTAANAAGARVASRTMLVLTALPLAALAWLFLVGLGGERRSGPSPLWTPAFAGVTLGGRRGARGPG